MNKKHYLYKINNTQKNVIQCGFTQKMVVDGNTTTRNPSEVEVNQNLKQRLKIGVGNISEVIISKRISD